MRFHLHDTFRKSVYTRPVRAGRATLEDVVAYGAFTLGAEADDGATLLEHDLAEDDQLRERFRTR